MNIVWTIALVSVWQLVSPFLDRSSREAKQGMESYRQEDWVDAASRFDRANTASPDPALDYNGGAASYRGQNYEEAGEAFLKAQRSDALPKGEAAFALGNTRFRSEDLEGALEAYREALLENPGHEGARYNYELTRRILEAQQQQQQQNQDQQQQDKKEGDGSQGEGQQAPPDSSGKEQQEPKPQEGQDPKQEEQPSEPSEQSQDPQQGEQAAPKDPDQLLSAEEAKKLLDQITPGERDLIEQRLRSGKRKRAEKDW